MVTTLYSYRQLKLSILLRVLIATVVGLLSTSFAIEVSAQIDRGSVEAGKGAVLELRVTGSRSAEPKLPDIENFLFRPRGQRQQVQMFNGRMTVSVQYNYAVGSNVPGDYQIPPIEVVVDGKSHFTQPMSLKVIDNGAQQPPPGAANPTPEDEEPEDTGEKRFGFLTVELQSSDRKHAYVGEIAPVRIRAWLPESAQARLRSGIQPEGKGFTLHNVSDQPQETQEMRDGKRYNVITWFGGISATKPGKLPASLSLSATVAVRDKSPQRPRRRMGGPFDDPFFDSVFDQMNTPMIQKDVTLKSDDQEIEVRALPTEGRPAGFSGAVGDFKFRNAKVPSNWNTGEPRQIEAVIEGAGNFALMKSPSIASAEGWKVYPAKDEFTPTDRAAFSGVKRFIFSAVPRKPGDQAVSLKFSFFEPNSGSYKTVNSDMTQVQVTGKELVKDESASPAPSEEPQKKSDLLMPQTTKLSPRASLTPISERPYFFPILISAVLLGIGARIWSWWRSKGVDPARHVRAATELAIREAIAQASKAANENDVHGYFAAGRLALQHSLSAQWRQAAQAITLAEVAKRFTDDAPVTRFFREADRQEYSATSTGSILPEWRTLLDEAIVSLNPTAS